MSDQIEASLETSGIQKDGVPAQSSESHHLNLTSTGFCTLYTIVLHCVYTILYCKLRV